MTERYHQFAAVLLSCLIGGTVAACAGTGESERKPGASSSMKAERVHQVANASGSTLQSERKLTGQHAVIGTVEQVTSGHIKVNTGEVEPRFLPLKQAQERGDHGIKKGDKLIITLNEQNLVVNYHEIGAVTSGHKVINGALAVALPVGQEHAVIRTENGVEESYDIRSQAVSKMAGLAIGTPAIFTIDETNHIVDVLMLDVESQKHGESGSIKSPIKGVDRRVDGVIAEPIQDSRITIRTQDGREHAYQVRPLMTKRLLNLERGQTVTLLLDEEDQVIDVATTEGGKG